MITIEFSKADEERKARYMERKSAKERKQNAENLRRKKDRAGNMQKCLTALREMGGGTAGDVAAHLGLKQDTVRDWIFGLHKERFIYVHDFTRVEGCPKRVAVYRIGNHPDKVPELKSGRSSDEREDHERARRKHEAWKKTWTPHCDIAAAWMMGGIAA